MSLRVSIVLFVALGIGLASTASAADLQPVFTYQGSLDQNGSPATGSYSMNFRLFDAATSGNQLGSTITYGTVNVNDGLFQVILNSGAEFGPTAFNGERRWLEITVNGETLSPRTALTPAPFAQRSQTSALAEQAQLSERARTLTRPDGVTAAVTTAADGTVTTLGRGVVNGTFQAVGASTLSNVTVTGTLNGAAGVVTDSHSYSQFNNGYAPGVWTTILNSEKIVNLPVGPVMVWATGPYLGHTGATSEMTGMQMRLNISGLTSFGIGQAIPPYVTSSVANTSGAFLLFNTVPGPRQVSIQVQPTNYTAFAPSQQAAWTLVAYRQ